MRDVIVFDYDGTLHESMRLFKPAILSAYKWLTEEKGIALALPPDEQISSWLGMNMKDTWDDFAPGVDDELKRQGGMIVGQHLVQNLRDGLGGWYDGVEEMLTVLAEQGYEMAVLSNCGDDYGVAHFETFDMGRYFAAFFACQSWGQAPKGEIMQDLQRDFAAGCRRVPSHREPVIEDDYRIVAMVGDRDSDKAGGDAIGVPFIGCRYGYCRDYELQEADAIAHDPREIPDLLAQVLHGRS